MKIKSFIFIICVPMIITGNETNLNVHVFGDSHSYTSFRNVTNSNNIFNYKNKSIKFNIHWFWGATMHKVGRDGINFLNINNLGVQEKDIAVFVFGAIDVYWHIGKQRDFFQRNLDEILDSLVEKYIKTILKNKKQYKQLDCVIFCIIPPSNSNNTFYGSIEDRIDISKKLNSKLKIQAQKNDIKTLDLYNILCTDKGDLKPELSDGTSHINPNNSFVKEKLIDLILSNF